MLITFRSKAYPDIVMYIAHVKPFLDLLGKDIERGIITADESAHALGVLDDMIAQRQETPPTLPDVPEAGLNPEDVDTVKKHVSLSARFFPLREMLTASQQKHCDILWGV